MERVGGTAIGSAWPGQKGGRGGRPGGNNGKGAPVTGGLPGTSPVTQTNNSGSPAPGGGVNVNPWYAQLESMYRAQGASEAANLRSSIQQMLIGYGLVPEGFQDKFGALDEVTRALIKKNTDTGISTLARLKEGQREGVKGLVNRLASRGLGRSGAKGYGLRKNQLGFDRNLADSLSQLMGQVGSMYGGYANNEYARQAALMNAYMQYYTGAGESRGGDSVSGVGSGTAPGQQTRNVGSSYDNPDGTLYNFGGGWWGY